MKRFDFKKYYSDLMNRQPERQWKICPDCDGSGFYVFVETSDGHLEYSGLHATGINDLEDRDITVYDEKRYTCRLCRGLGTYHYDIYGRMIPGKGDEFDTWREPPRKRIEYREYVKSDEWRRKAAIAKAHAGWCCRICNRHESDVVLDAHHRTYERLGHERLDDLTVLCRDCHALYKSHNRLG